MLFVHILIKNYGRLLTEAVSRFRSPKGSKRSGICFSVWTRAYGRQKPKQSEPLKHPVLLQTIPILLHVWLSSSLPCHESRRYVTIAVYPHRTEVTQSKVERSENLTQ